MKTGDQAFIKLHHGYNIPSTNVLGKELSQQYVGPFQILEKISCLAYRLGLSNHWRIHPVLSVAQLEPAPLEKDPFDCPRPDHPNPHSYGLTVWFGPLSGLSCSTLRPTITKATTRPTARNPYDFPKNPGSALSVFHYNEFGVRTAFSPLLAGSILPNQM